MNIQKISDEKEILSIINQFESLFPHLSEQVQDYQGYAHKLAQNAIVYVAREYEQNYGVAMFYANDIERKIAFLSLLGILPKWQGRHLGKQMMELVCKEAINRGMKRIRLEVHIDNTRAIAFYSSCGFERKEKCSEKSIFMEKDL